MAANSKSSPSAGSPTVKSNRTLRSVFVAVLAAFSALIGVSTIYAQEATVSMRIDVVAWGSDISGLSFKKGESNGEITALAFRYSEPIAYSGPAVMEIYKTGGDSIAKIEMTEEQKEHELIPLIVEETPPAPGEAPPSPLAAELEKRRKDNPNLVALATLPGPSCKRATILLAPAANGTYIAYVIDDDPSKLPPGKLRVHNLSPYEINIRCNGRDAKELKTRNSHIFPAANNTIIYELAYKLENEWIVQENNILSLDPEEQIQMIILKSRNQFFLSAEGAAGGFLQLVTLRRSPKQPPPTQNPTTP